MATSYSDILLTDDGDIDLSTDSVIFIDSNQLSLRQRLNMRFAVWQGEWKYNSAFGTPYKSYVGKPTTKSAMDAEIKRQIFKETDVISINSFSSSLNRQARTYTCVAIISTREEDSLTYFLNMRDSFEYILPNINTTCPKLPKYMYLTSYPYPEDLNDTYFGGLYDFGDEQAAYGPFTTTVAEFGEDYVFGEEETLFGS